MSDWLNRVFEDTTDRADNLAGRAEDRLDLAGERADDVEVELEVELEIEATVGLEGSWTDSDGQSHEWGNSTTISTGETDLSLGLSTDLSESQLDSSL